MPTIFELEFNKDGDLVQPQQVDAIKGALSGAGVTDVVVISHGWNNNIAEARSLYTRFFQTLTPQDLANAVVVGIFWPSKKFTDEELIPGGAAGLGGAEDVAVTGGLEDLKAAFLDDAASQELDSLKELVPLLDDEAIRQQFVHRLGALLEAHTSPNAPEDGREPLSTTEKDVLKLFGAPVLGPIDPNAGGAAGFGGAGGGAGFGEFFENFKVAAQRLINFTTYWIMKGRAGKIGANSLNPILHQLQTQFPALRLHLVGHSFGGRLVTATTDGGSSLKVQSLILLQAAYSHNGLSSDYDGNGTPGFFHKILTQNKVSGPILITHTRNDTAVGYAYPLASRINGDDAAALGGPEDRFGGMGSNGAQHANAVNTELLGADQTYQLDPTRKVFNLKSDRFIAEHNDVARPETAHLLRYALNAARALVH